MLNSVGLALRSITIMGRFHQNIIYAGILIAIIGFFWAIAPQHLSLPKGIYLPQSVETFATVSEKEVNFYSTDNMDIPKAVPAVAGFGANPIGIIRVDTHYNTTAEIPASCQQNMTEARRLAAVHGATKIIGNCLTSGKVGPLSGANLYAYAYR